MIVSADEYNFDKTEGIEKFRKALKEISERDGSIIKKEGLLPTVSEKHDGETFTSSSHSLLFVYNFDENTPKKENVFIGGGSYDLNNGIDVGRLIQAYENIFRRDYRVVHCDVIATSNSEEEAVSLFELSSKMILFYEGFEDMEEEPIDETIEAGVDIVPLTCEEDYGFYSATLKEILENGFRIVINKQFLNFSNGTGVPSMLLVYEKFVEE